MNIIQTSLITRDHRLRTPAHKYLWISYVNRLIQRGHRGMDIRSMSLRELHNLYLKKHN